MPAERPRFELILEDRGGEVPTAARLRALLKRALRSFGFKCVNVTEYPAGGRQRQPEPTEEIR
jgi:hypothetical protein